MDKSGIAVRFESEAKALYRWFDVYAHPIHESETHLVGILFRDITDKKHQEALRESESRLKSLTRATVEVVYRMNPDWTQMHQLEGRGFLKDAANSNSFWLDEYIPTEDQSVYHILHNRLNF